MAIPEPFIPAGRGVTARCRGCGTLAAWREAERRLVVTSDPREVPVLLAEVERLYMAYLKAVEAAG
jgi:hypothetical protein